MTTDIQTNIEQDVLTITINRPDKKNALTQVMYQTMADALTQAGADKSVRVVVITGVNDSFTAGNDLADFLAANQAQDRNADGVRNFMKALFDCPKPVIASVNGLAIGIGTTMLLHCDYVIASDNALLKMPFSDLGLVPEFGSSVILPQMMGHIRASELLMLSTAINAEKAKDYGLVNVVCSADDLKTVTEKMAQTMADKPASALRRTKAMMRANKDDIWAVIEKEYIEFDACLKSPEAFEAMSSFMEKRAPNFRQFD